VRRGGEERVGGGGAGGEYERRVVGECARRRGGEFERGERRR
jgi:hypothetical protein